MSQGKIVCDFCNEEEKWSKATIIRDPYSEEINNKIVLMCCCSKKQCKKALKEKYQESLDDI